MVALLQFLLVVCLPFCLIVSSVVIYGKLVFVEKRKFLTRQQLKKELLYHVLYLVYAAAMVLYIYRLYRGGAPTGAEGPAFDFFVGVGCPYFLLFVLRYGIIIAFRGAALLWRAAKTLGGKGR